jgi:hypothetical protein
MEEEYTDPGKNFNFFFFFLFLLFLLLLLLPSSSFPSLFPVVRRGVGVFRQPLNQHRGDCVGLTFGFGYRIPENRN